MIKIDRTTFEDMLLEMRGIQLDSNYKLIKTNLEKPRVEATYKYKDIDRDEHIEVKFCIPKFYIGDSDPIVDIKTLDNICRGLSLHENYYVDAVNIGREKKRVEYFNFADRTSIKVTTRR